MPQMAPLSWLMLYLTFSSALILFAAVNYFIFIHETPKSTTTGEVQSSPLTWQW